MIQNENHPKEEYRLCNTDDLRVLSARSTVGRRMPTEIGSRLDPEGTHVLNIVLWGHNVDNPANELHHRVRVLARLQGTKEPSDGFLIDIRDSDWKRLHKYEPSDTA